MFIPSHAICKWAAYVLVTSRVLRLKKQWAWIGTWAPSGNCALAVAWARIWPCRDLELAFENSGSPRVLLSIANPPGEPQEPPRRWGLTRSQKMLRNSRVAKELIFHSPSAPQEAQGKPQGTLLEVPYVSKMPLGGPMRALRILSKIRGRQGASFL